MARTIAFIAQARACPLDTARFVVVCGCALALIAAGAMLPSVSLG
jgi:hypothetical protein